MDDDSVDLQEFNEISYLKENGAVATVTGSPSSSWHRSTKDIKRDLLKPYFQRFEGGVMIARILERMHHSRSMPEHHRKILDRLSVDEAFGDVSRSVRMLNALEEHKAQQTPEYKMQRFTDVPDFKDVPFALN